MPFPIGGPLEWSL